MPRNFDELQSPLDHKEEKAGDTLHDKTDASDEKKVFIFIGNCLLLRM